MSNEELNGDGSQKPLKESPNATTILVLGILGLVICGVCAIIALVMGNSEFKKGYPKTGNLYAGWILGLIGTILFGLIVVVGIIWLVVVGIAVSSFQ